MNNKIRCLYCGRMANMTNSGRCGICRNPLGQERKQKMSEPLNSEEILYNGSMEDIFSEPFCPTKK